MFEEWKAVVGYEGRYEISNLGQVKSLPNIRRYGERILRAAVMPSGHFQVSLSALSTSKSRLVHILVLEAFVGPRPGDSVNWHGCHSDSNPANNRLDNLRWDTRSGNESDKVANGTSNRGSRNRASKLSQAQVVEIKSRILVGEKSPDIALIYGVSRGAINAIKRGRAWSWL